MTIANLDLVLEEKLVAPAVVTHLFQELGEHGVRYCHWKSTIRLDKGLAGETDLDLLVDRKQGRIFRQILSQHDVKPVLAPPGGRYPAVEDYLGFDPASGKLFHLHTHYQLVLGEQFVKNYRLPLEKQFLDSVRFKEGIPIPPPELEIAVLALRALLKYRDRDAIRDILSIRGPGLPAHILGEIKYLLDQTSVERISQALMPMRDVMPLDLILQFLNTVVKTPRAGFTLYRLRGEVRRALRPYERDNRPRAALKYFREAWGRRKRFRPARKRLMTLPSGGITIGLIGADGSGKSTLCKMLAQWMGWKLDVRAYYLGSKQPSRSSRLLYLLFRMARRSHRILSDLLGEQNFLCKLQQALRQSLLYTYHLSIGRDRYRRYLEGRKKAMSGSIVLYDRYPLESLRNGAAYRLLDGPQIQLHENAADPLARRFASAEQEIYQRILPPDHLIVLDVSPDISLQRKPDHKQAAVEAKTRAVGELTATAELDSGMLQIIHINTDLPFEQVVSQLKMKIWEVL